MRRIALATGLCLTLIAAGCSSAPEPVATATATATAKPTVSAPTPVPTKAPEFNASGTAPQNLGYFELVLQQLLEVNASPSGRQIIDHLVASGFDKSQMELSAAETAIGGKVDSLQFSVIMNGTCLIGQVSPEGYHAISASLLGTGTCLVGKTPPIDW